jgi:hypothetical protein
LYSLSKKEWTATMDLGKLAEDYILDYYDYVVHLN